MSWLAHNSSSTLSNNPSLQEDLFMFGNYIGSYRSGNENTDLAEISQYVYYV